MNEQNLVRGDEAHKLTAEEQSKGGKASAESRRAKRDLKRAFEVLLEKDYKDTNGMVKSGAEMIAFKQFLQALQGDQRSFEIVRDTAGQKPVEKVMIAEVDQDVIDEVERIVLDEQS